jgi:hypothetical protein
MKPNHVAAVVVALWVTGLAQSALACPDDQYEQCFLGACVCLPKMGGDIGNAAEHIKKETHGQTGGPILEAWLIGSRNTSIGTSGPIPPSIRQALSGYIEDDVMNRARFKVGDNGILNLAGLSIAYGDGVFGNSVAAVTLVDVIVFASEDDAYNNVSLWAHELTHVKQFRDWGTRDFSISYARDVGSVEDPAYAVGNNYASWNARRNQTPFPPRSFPQQQPAGFAPGFGMLVCGCYGPNAPLFAPEPRCQSQSVRLNACPGSCAGGGSPYAYVCQ